MARRKNNYFQFKQFRVEQDKTAMKVCTDSCIFGAWVNCENTNRILDIGTGTGLLSLMLAQRCSAQIEAVEIDADAAAQAKENFEASPWSGRLNLIHQDFKVFAGAVTEKYNLIVSNPPFYEGSLKSPDEARNKAMHLSELSFGDLINGVKNCLNESGKFAVLLPVYESGLLKKICEQADLYPEKCLKIRNTEQESFIREITLYSFFSNSMQTEELFIRDKSGEYSTGFKNLLQEYYLIF